MMTVSEVARHLGLNWKTVKDIDKHFLQRDYGQPDLNGFRGSVATHNSGSGAD
jgi:hypothetical protein